MNTAEALEAITDRGKFERLVTSILRRADSNYAAIIHTGINPKGEPIPSPVDGFCLVPGSKPDHFLFLQHTTIERSKLRNKWLNDSDGDLIKANKIAQEVRKKNQEAEFTIILATNQYLSLDLIKDTCDKAREFKLKPDIWEQSRLAGFLDGTPDGHWLRREYLGIEAERLSEPLLGYICKKSLAHYEKGIQSSDPGTWIPRTIDDFIRSSFLENRYTFQALVGDSGYGKSVAAYKALRRHIESGGYGLCVPAEFISNSTSIDTAIDKVFAELYPHLLSGSGEYTRNLIPKGSKFILVVDDVNRTNSPNKIITSLRNWSRPYRSETVGNETVKTPKNLSSDYFIICPLWPQIWDYNQSKSSWIQTVSIGPMSPEEGSSAVGLVISEAGRSLSSTEKQLLATKLGNDPVLIGLFYHLIIGESKSVNLNEMAEDVVEKFIFRCIDEVAIDGGSYLPNEYSNSLSKICINMLRKSRFYPSWEEIQVWFNEDQEILKVLRELIQNKKLIRLTDREDRLIFRHDRIRETFLVKNMISILEDPLSNAEILQEPYYAEIIGKAIVLSPQSDTFLKNLAESLPLALFEAIKNFGNPTTDYHRKIIDVINDWIEKNLVGGAVLDSVINSICWSLIETDSNAILELTTKFPPYWSILLSRVRNGSAKSGSEYCNRISIDMGDNLRDQIIEHAKKKT